MVINEPVSQFESRKVDHVRLALQEKHQTAHLSDFNSVRLAHEALPDLDFQDIQISTRSLGLDLPTPFLVSSMTAGHAESLDLNLRLARACHERGWLMGVGSQRRELFDLKAGEEWRRLRAEVPRIRLLGNVGLSQLIVTPLVEIQRLAENLEAVAMIIHTNPLQESLQVEGTPQFKGGLEKLEQLVKVLKIPVVLKETGCGFSHQTLSRLNETGVYAVDLSGAGGTHWGRIEGSRNMSSALHHRAAETFKDWGISTIDSMKAAAQMTPRSFEVWASGGVRTGLQAATLLAMGAQVVGFASTVLAAAMKGEKDLFFEMEALEFELKVALFCTGSASLVDLRRAGVVNYVPMNR